MNQNCEVNAAEIKRLEERVTKLEDQREADKKQVYELDKSLTLFIEEMKHISTDLKSVVTNFKEAIMRSTTAQEKELKHSNEKITSLEKKVEALEVKLEHETVEADANKWRNTSRQVLYIVLGAIVGVILGIIGLN